MQLSPCCPRARALASLPGCLCCLGCVRPRHVGAITPATTMSTITPTTPTCFLTPSASLDDGPGGVTVVLDVEEAVISERDTELLSAPGGIGTRARARARGSRWTRVRARCARCWRRCDGLRDVEGRCCAVLAIVTFMGMVVGLALFSDPLLLSMSTRLRRAACVTHNSTLQFGSSNCSWASCRESCTVQTYKCAQIFVTYTFPEEEEDQNETSSANSSSSRIGNDSSPLPEEAMVVVPLFVNVPGCGLEAVKYSCDRFNNDYMLVGKPFACEVSLSLAVPVAALEVGFAGGLPPWVLSLVPMLLCALCIAYIRARNLFSGAARDAPARSKRQSLRSSKQGEPRSFYKRKMLEIEEWRRVRREQALLHAPPGPAHVDEDDVVVVAAPESPMVIVHAVPRSLPDERVEQPPRVTPERRPVEAEHPLRVEERAVVHVERSPSHRERSTLQHGDDVPGSPNQQPSRPHERTSFIDKTNTETGIKRSAQHGVDEQVGPTSISYQDDDVVVVVGAPRPPVIIVHPLRHPLNRISEEREDHPLVSPREPESPSATATHGAPRIRAISESEERHRRLVEEVVRHPCEGVEGDPDALLSSQTRTKETPGQPVKLYSDGLSSELVKHEPVIGLIQHRKESVGRLLSNQIIDVRLLKMSFGSEAGEGEGRGDRAESNLGSRERRRSAPTPRHLSPEVKRGSMPSSPIGTRRCLSAGARARARTETLVGLPSQSAPISGPLPQSTAPSGSHLTEESSVGILRESDSARGYSHDTHVIRDSSIDNRKDSPKGASRDAPKNVGRDKWRGSPVKLPIQTVSSSVELNKPFDISK